MLLAAPATAQDIPGLVSARLLPGWEAGGQRFSALELVLEPGWKTYWRSPGDAGLPPVFDWQGIDADSVRFYWPAPVVFHAGGARSVGYHDRLLLPFSVPLEGVAAPLAAAVDFGLCREVCVPAHVALQAPDPDAAGPDPRIAAAMAAQPLPADTEAQCRMEAIDDGLRITARLPDPDAAEIEVVAELADAAIWVSEPEVARADGWLQAAFEAVAPDGKPFVLDGEAVRLTLLGPGTAVEFAGCRRAD